ncbi:hypothetical protein, partial [Salmonella enterica]|uniref:hypothetical protein n=1 Tax=Salmonella enterica TaxID=28901 RepID=UPI003CF36E3A
YLNQFKKTAHDPHVAMDSANDIATKQTSYASSAMNSSSESLFSARNSFTNTAYASQSNNIEEIQPVSKPTLALTV